MSKVIFRVVVKELDDGTIEAIGESDKHGFEYSGDCDFVYHEVENQLDSATTGRVT